MNSFNLIAVESNQLKSLIEESVKKAITDNSKQVTNSVNPKRYLTRKELSKKFNLSLPTIYRRMKDGSLPHFHIGRRVLFDENAVSKALMGGQNENN